MLGDQLTHLLIDGLAARDVSELLLARAFPVRVGILVDLEHLVDERLALESIRPDELDHVGHPVHPEYVCHLFLEQRKDALAQEAEFGDMAKTTR